MTPGMIHDLTVSKVLSNMTERYGAVGDGTPTSEQGEDDKDLQYWSLGRMMMHHRNAKGGFDKLVIAGLPAYRAVQNMQCLTGSGLTVPVESYTGAEMDGVKFFNMKNFYKGINEGLPQYRKMGIDLHCGDILDVLPTLDEKFNVFDFDFMVTPNGWTMYEDRVPKDRPVIKKDNCWVFIKTEEMDRIIQTVKDKRRQGPTAVYCNWAFGRQMSMEDWEKLRRGILLRFQLNFEVESYRWTWYRGNSRMCGIQLILGPNRNLKRNSPKKAKKVRTWGMVMTEIEPIDGERIKAVRAKLGYSQNDLAAELGVSNYTISVWENGRCGPLTLRPDAIDALKNLLWEHGC